MAPSPNNELSPYYYRDNFLRLCDTVEAQYEDVLGEEEQLLLRRFRNLAFDAQCLYVRLVSRVGPWFRVSRLEYPELGDLGSALAALDEAGLLFFGEELAIDELGQLYTRAELQQVFTSHLPEQRFGDKTALLAAVDGLPLDDSTITAMLCDLDGDDIVAPWGGDQVLLLQLLFFGNRRQSLTEFVLSDLGVANYFPYNLDRQQRLFVNREALDEYLACAMLSDCWYELRDTGDAQGMQELALELLSRQVNFESTKSRWHRLCNGLARDLEREGEFATAHALYAASESHPARERRARILERDLQWGEAAALCEEILLAPWCERESEAARRILHRARRKLGGKPAPRARDHFSELHMSVAQEDGSVELLVARALSGDWRSVHYVENSLFKTLFGLAFWEQIFAPLPGVFHHAYQTRPSDMFEPTFRQRRCGLLDRRMEELRCCDLRRELSAAYRRYQGYLCSWVDWRYIDLALVQDTLAVVPPEHLLAIWQRMLFDPLENRSGFPDLIALGTQQGEYSLIEVKGPGDALQDGQKRWLRFFQQQGIPSSVAWVSWSGD